MAAITAPATAPLAVRHSRTGAAIADGLAVTWRNLKGMSRTPEVIVFSTIQPIIFVLTFRYVFGGSIQVPGSDYVDFLMPGIFVQTVVFGAMNTGIGLSEDLHKGLIERFRSLPMARSAVLSGRTMADLVRNIFVVTMMVIVGFAVGFDFTTSWLAMLGAIALLLLFGFAMAWIFALIGLSAANAEAAQAASFPILAILVFASTAFAPAENMPGWLQAYNNVNPVSVTVDAVRALCLGGETLVPVLEALAWSVVLLLIFVPLAVNRYRRVA
jgi:ABC-2 type transport system permease protein/oleandomycin transport system permease protein